MIRSAQFVLADELNRMLLPPCPVILKPMLRPASTLSLTPSIGAVASSVLMFPPAPAPMPAPASITCVVRLLRRSFHSGSHCPYINLVLQP